MKDRVTITIPDGPYCNRPVTARCACLTSPGTCQHPYRKFADPHYQTKTDSEARVRRSPWCLERNGVKEKWNG